METTLKSKTSFSVLEPNQTDVVHLTFTFIHLDAQLFSNLQWLMNVQWRNEWTNK